MRFASMSAALTVAVFALWAHAADPLPEAFRYDLSAVRSVEGVPVLFRETAAWSIPVTGALCLAAAPDGALIVGGASALARLASNGRMEWVRPVTGDVACVTVDEDGMVYAGIATRVELYDRDATPLLTAAELAADAILTSLAVIDGHLFVADAAARVVHHFGPDGTRIRQLDGRHAGSPKGFILPSPYFDVAPAIDGTLWVVNPGRHRVQNYARDGSLRSEWGRAGMDVAGFCGCCNPTHVALMPDGSFVTAEKGIPRVKLYTADGAFLGLVAGPDTFDEAERGLDLATDAAGRVFVLDGAAALVRVFERGGTP